MRRLLFFSMLLIRKGVGVPVVLVLNVVHLFLHGTPLDGGGLDAAIMWANAFALTSAPEVHDG